MFTQGGRLGGRRPDCTLQRWHLLTVCVACNDTYKGWVLKAEGTFFLLFHVAIYSKHGYKINLVNTSQINKRTCHYRHQIVSIACPFHKASNVHSVMRVDSCDNGEIPPTYGHKPQWDESENACAILEKVETPTIFACDFLLFVQNWIRERKITSLKQNTSLLFTLY